MAYDEGVAQRIREILRDRQDVMEKKMFGGLAFMVAGHMCCGVVGEKLMARVGTEQYETALRKSHAREMDFTKKPLKGYIYVDPQGFESDQDLAAWLKLCLTFISTLPPK